VDWNYKRNSVRITSADLFPVSSVWVADLYHIPYGVSLKIIERLAKHLFAVLGLASLVVAITELAHRRVSEIVIDFFPSKSCSEIDTLEGVNLMTLNQMSLHTLPGCTVISPNETSTLINSTDCSYLSNDNQGCIVTDPDPAAYGAASAQAGGGVFVTEFAESGIS
jgi:hypothetical protein